MFILKHGLKKRKQYHNLDDVVTSQEFQKVCIGLSQLAYQLETNGKINFTEDDLLSTADGSDEILELLNDSGMIIKFENTSMHSKSYQFFHYTFHEFLVAIHLFVRGDKGLPNSHQINTMLAGLIGLASRLDATPTLAADSIAQRIAEVIRQENIPYHQALVSLEDLVRSSYKQPIHSHELFFLIYEYKPRSFKANIKVYLESMLRDDTYLKQAYKFVLQMCNENQFEAGTCCIFSIDNSVFVDGLDRFLCSFKKLKLLQKNVIAQVAGLHLRRDRMFERIECKAEYCFTALDLLQHTQDLSVELLGNELVNMIVVLQTKKQQYQSIPKTIDCKLKENFHKHSKQLKPLKDLFKTYQIKIVVRESSDKIELARHFGLQPQDSDLEIDFETFRKAIKKRYLENITFKL